MTKIEWTDSSWNPIVGCSIVSPGCTNCYAMRTAKRIEAIDEAAYRRTVNKAVACAEDGDHEERIRSKMNNGRVVSHYAGTTKPSKAGPVWTGKVALAPERTILEPLRRKKPTMYFVNSMGDPFHEDVPDEWIDRVFAVVALCPQHTFQVLTKRSARMRAYISAVADKWCVVDGRTPCVKIDEAMDDIAPDHWCTRELQQWPLSNVWLGVSAERQQEADARIPDLLATPAAVRFVSTEPMLGPVDFTKLDVPHYGFLNALDDGNFADGRPPRRRLDWVIVGGESGPGARPMHPDWARSIRDQCLAAGVPFFFKQHGSWMETFDRDRDDPDWRRCDLIQSNTSRGQWLNIAGGQGFHGDRVIRVIPASKSRPNGRLLDGREWNETPNGGHKSAGSAGEEASCL